MTVTLPTTLALPTDLPTHKAGFAPPSLTPASVSAAAQTWLATAERAAITADGALFASLFAAQGFWRDILAFTNDYRSIRTPNVAAAANAVFPAVQANNFVFAAGVPPKLESPFPDVTFLAVHFTFATAVGEGYGIAQLVFDEGSWKAYTVFTILDGVDGATPATGVARPRGEHNTPLCHDDTRALESSFVTADPEVLIRHNGLALAAQLGTYGVSALVVDKQQRTGDNWRLRYKSLSLHDPVHACHLPFIPFPATWPKYTPAGKLANFLEAYVDMLELNVWNKTTVDPARTRFDEGEGKWHVMVVRTLAEGQVEEREIVCSHVVLATGLGGGRPKMPAPFPGQATWDGVAMHSSQHNSGADWRGKRALVVGACTSGHDICVDMAKNGVDVTMLQRSPTFVMTVENGMNAMVSPLYNESTPSLDLADKIAEANPKFVVKLFHKRIIEHLQEADKEVLDGLTRAGFNWWKGPDDSGFIMMALDKAGGYYHSTGGSEAIGRGEIKVKQGEIASFAPNHNVSFKDGSSEKYDVVVFATGYTGFPDMVRDTLGQHYAQTFKPVWGLDAEGEIQGVGRESGIPNMFFSVGALAPARVTSKVIALQIVMQQRGLWRERYTYERQLEDGGIAAKKVINGH